ncbi:chromosome partitioning protein ParA [Mucilaginibacter terrenus]|uniref:Chromosome partitioning protein ParA n=2 Tax=Mucilaginibacter terrenus TaxID=2482727 RepID=A0A3E2NK35_9SPHI|nr:chromosome partitioning protein ParA [Mucilaginibacter terrenus]
MCVAAVCAKAQKVLDVDNQLDQHKFTFNDVAVLEDRTGKLNFADVTGKALVFKNNQSLYPSNNVNASTYWMRVRVRFDEALESNTRLIEFFDQTTDEVTAYLPDTNGTYKEVKSGANMGFSNRLFHHKNFEFLLKNATKGEHVYYFKVRSHNLVNIIMVYRTVGYFVRYALNEYLGYGLFYGMILIFCFHNLLMFIAVRRKHYLFYVFYVISVGLYEMSADGIAFQYLWPDMPVINHYGYGVALYLISFFALVFSKELLQVKYRAPLFNKLINWVIVLRSVYFLYCLMFAKGLFVYKFVEVIPLSVCFAAGIYIYGKGFQPARFFVLAYSILFVGFIIKALTALKLLTFLPSAVSYYSLSGCFVMEMVLLSFAIGDQVRLFKKEKEAADNEAMRQMKLNAELKDSINRELELQVAIRTKEVVEKSEKLQLQKEVIERQNRQLLTVNRQLELQAEEISRMNVLLEKDNVELKTSIERVTESRALSAELNFEEFSAKYPDQETCFGFLSSLKWKDGYSCTRCENTSYCGGRLPHSRRCTKCSYEESAIHNTIFENNRIPINKAFYITYLMYITNGTISSHQLSEKLQIRQSTCWTYAMRIKKVMQEKKRSKLKGDQQGWSTLVV